MLFHLHANYPLNNTIKIYSKNLACKFCIFFCLMSFNFEICLFGSSMDIFHRVILGKECSSRDVSDRTNTIHSKNSAITF